MKTGTWALAAVGAILFVWYRVSVVPFTVVNRASREPAFPVDAVYTWVDSSDVNWQNDLMQRQGVGDKRPERFPSERHADTELKLSMALADKHMPWLRYIFIVVARPQHCKWWADYPKIRVVYHDELVSVGLPTFNSVAIELFLHRIPGLAEHFVYFNDDLYVLRPVPKSVFFDSTGGFYSLVETLAPRFQLPYLSWYVFGDPYMLAQLRLANELGYVRKLNRLHVPCAMTKSGLQRALKRWPQWTRKTLLRPFRSPDDFPVFEAAINMNGRVLKDGPKSMYTSNRMVFTASTIKDVTFAIFNNPRTEEDYQTIQRVLRLRLGHGNYKT